MKPAVRKTLYIVLIILVVPTFYSIFNVGNPKSLFRVIIKDPSWDVLTTVVLALSMAVIGLVLSAKSTRDNSIEQLLEMNKDHIKLLKDKGRSDYSIAEEFLKQLQIKRKGLLYRLALRKVLKYLDKMD